MTGFFLNLIFFRIKILRNVTKNNFEQKMGGKNKKMGINI
jgi:hypothetical protein